MRILNRFFVLLAVTLVFSSSSNAATYATVQAGNWESAATWTCVDTPSPPTCATANPDGDPWPPGDVSNNVVVVLRHGTQANPLVMDGSGPAGISNLNVQDGGVVILESMYFQISDNILIESDGGQGGGTMNVNGSYIFSVNGNISNQGTTNFPGGCITLVNGNFENADAAARMQGFGNLLLENGNISDSSEAGSGGTYDPNVDWCTENGNTAIGVPENCNGAGGVLAQCAAVLANVNNGPLSQNDTIDGSTFGVVPNQLNILVNNGNGADAFGPDGQSPSTPMQLIDPATLMPVAYGVSIPTAQGGTVVINPGPNPGDASDDVVLYTPPDTGGATLADTFQYQICDGNTVGTPPAPAAVPDCSAATVTISAINNPVTLDSFASGKQGSSLQFKWSTASETFNFGFNLWGEVEGQWHRLNKTVVPSRGADSLVSQRYRKRVSIADLPGEVTRVGISSVEINGHEAFFGPYEIGAKVGEEIIIEPIDWNTVAEEAVSQLKAQGYVQRGRNFVRERKARRLASASSIDGSGLDTNHALSGNSVLAEFRTEAVGMHRVTHGDLLSAGVDLSGLNTADLALLNQGDAQVRFINGNGWTSASYIDFYNVGVNDETSLHTSESVFRLEHDTGRSSVLAAGTIDRNVASASQEHRAQAVRNEQLTYDFVMPKPDPWYERYLFLNPNNQGSAGTVHNFTLDVENVVASNDAINDATVTARVITLTDFGTGMDHRVELVHVNASGVESTLDVQSSDGYAALELTGTLSGTALAASSQFKVKQKLIDVNANTGQLPAHWLGSAAYFDSASVSYTASNQSRDNVLHWAGTAAERNDGYRISGLASNQTAAYAWNSNSLMRLTASNAAQNSVAWQIDVPKVAFGEATYWVSTVSALHVPVVASPAIDVASLNTGSSDYLIIAHPSFIDRLENPDTQNGELDFIANKQSHGHNVKVVDYEQVAQVYGDGYRTPDAMTAYLTAETYNNSNLKYVLLVGNASRDPNNYSGNGSWNLIPTYYDSTHGYLNYAPNDGKLADTNGDGFQDLAIGRWPARTAADLNTFIAKTIQYTDGSLNTSATQGLNTAVLAADVHDGHQDFSAQMDTVESQLSDAGFNTTKVYKDNGNGSQDLIDAINAGQSITSYSGHAGPAQWSYNGLLHYNQVSQLTNKNHPTLMLPLSCYTTYTVSEHTDTLGQKLMSDDNGAVAIMGAASLSSYAENQMMITDIMQSMTTGVDTDGDNHPDITLSLGEAVTRAKQATMQANSPVNISGNLIGDPSIRIGAQHSTSGMATRALRAF